jgi:hypothetical protein
MAETPGRGPSWKHRKDKGPAQAGKRTWQHGGDRSRDADAGGGNRSRRLRNRILGALLLLLVVGAITAIVYLLYPTKPLGVVQFAMSDPAALNQPLNVCNAQFAKELSGWAEKHTGPVPPTTLNDWKTYQVSGWLDWFVKAGKQNTESIFFIGMPGHADEVKGAFLWVIPPGADAPLPEHKLYVSDLLDRLHKDLPNKRKVLIFDCTQTASSWLHGMARNDFARGLKSLENKIAGMKNCMVVCASSEDERSWVSPERGLSIYAHYFLHALRGGARHEDKRSRVSLKDVHLYTVDQVDKWAKANRGMPQTPFLLPANQIDAADAITMATVAGDPPRPPEPVKRDPLVDLRGQWDTWYTLAREAVPETVAPHAWRRYTELLLRLEQLHWLGASSDDVNAVTDALKKLKGDIRQAEVALDQKDTLIADLVAGPLVDLEKQVKDTEARSLLEEIWKRKAEHARAKSNEEKLKVDQALAEPVQKWTALQNRVKNDRALTLFGWRWVAERFQEEADVAAAEGVCKHLEDTLALSTRPADIHLLRMLYRDCQQGPWTRVLEKQDLLKRVIKLRRTAEQVAWRGAGQGRVESLTHVAHVYPWIRRDVESADEQRRSAEDLLFDAHSESWAKAGNYAQEAEKLYARAAQVAQAVLEAEQLRDRAFARLPYYSRWLADCRDQAFDPSTLDRLVTLTETTWGLAHELSRQLAVTPDTDNPPVPNTDKLKQNLTELAAALHKLVSERAVAGGEAQASSWHALDSLLSMPFYYDAFPGNADKAKSDQALSRRAEILQKLRHSSYTLASNWQQPDQVGTVPVPFKAEDQARRQLRLALASFGTDAIRDAKNGLSTLPDLTWSVDRQVGSDRDENLRLANKLGQYWSGLYQVIGGVKHEGAKAAQDALGQTGTVGSLPGAERWFARAAQLTRLLDPGTREPPEAASQKPPLQVENWYRTHRFLLWQARRTLADGWASLIPGAVPAHSVQTAEQQKHLAQEVIKGLIGDSTPLKTGWYAAVKEIEPHIKPPALSMQLTGVTRPGQLLVTDEETIKLNYAVQQEPRQGYPVVRMWSTAIGPDTGYKKLRLATLQFPDQPSAFSQTEAKGAVTWVSPVGRQDAASAPPADCQLRSMTLYRGHYFQNDTTQVSFETIPRLHWTRKPATETPGLVVFGNAGAYDGQVHILFDVTLSMGKPLARSSQTRIDAASKALEQVLRELPNGVDLSISVFSALGDQPVIKPRAAGCTELIYGPKKWDKQDLNRVMQKIPDEKRLLEYRGELTPLVRALHETLFPTGSQDRVVQSEQTRLTILMITDGMDTTNLPVNLPKHTDEAIAKTLLDSRIDVELHVLLFALSEEELVGPKFAEERLRLEHLNRLNSDSIRGLFRPDDRSVTRTPPRLWGNLRDTEALARALTDTLRPRITVGNDQKDIAKIPVTLDTDSQWNLFHFPENKTDIGPFTVRTSTANQRVTVRPGDRLGLRLERAGRGQLFTVPSFTEIYPKLEPDKKGDGYELTLISQTPTPLGRGNSLDLRVALEKPNRKPDPEHTLQMARPTLAWFTLDPLEKHSGKVSLSVTNVSGQLAPLWEIKGWNWPAAPGKLNPVSDPAPYKLQAYWLNGVIPPRVPSLLEIPRLSDLANSKVMLPQSIEGVTVHEPVIREYPPNSRRKWLYVRCTHPPEEPVLLQLRLVQQVGFTDPELAEEHFYFAEAHSVSAWFDITKFHDHDRKYILDLYSLKSLLESEKTTSLKFESSTPATKFNQLPTRDWTTRTTQRRGESP